MPLVLTTPPAVSPVTVEQARAHLRVDETQEDALIASMIEAATRRVEFETAQALITQRWSLLRDCWPRDGILAIPLHPVQAVEEIRILTASGLQTAAAESYETDLASRPARIRALSGFPVPARRMNVIEVRLRAGHGDAPADVPAPLRQAILIIVAHWFEHREGHDETIRAGIPAEARRIIESHREVRL